MNWTNENIPAQDGRVVLITGANSGIGFVTAKVLSERGAEVILGCRDEGRAQAAVAAIVAQVPTAKVRYRLLDLASLESVHTFATEFLAAEPRLDILINNAGVMMPSRRKETREGFELQIGVNHLGHFALTGLLIDLLAQRKGSRVVTVASLAHRMGHIDFADMNWRTRRYNRVGSYGQSKLANLMFAIELDRKLKANQRPTLSVAAHPGWSATELQRNILGSGVFNKLIAMPPEKGALPTLRAATEPGLTGGEYFGPSGWLEVRGAPTLAKVSADAKDDQLGANLWAISQQLTGVTPQL